MLFVYRHGETEARTNCLSELGLHRAKLVARLHGRVRNAAVYTTRRSTDEPALVASLQMAATVCTHMGCPLHLVAAAHELPPNRADRDQVVVWPHGEVAEILAAYGFENDFAWPEENHTGCVRIFDDDTWGFDPKFMYSVGRAS